jgi:hypothetical protein
MRAAGRWRVASSMATAPPSDRPKTTIRLGDSPFCSTR